MSADVFLVRSWKRKYESSTEFISCKSTETQTNQTYFLGSLRRFSFYLRSLSTWATGDQVLQISGSLTQSMSNIKLWISGFSFCVLNQIWLENMLLNHLNYIQSGEIMMCLAPYLLSFSSWDFQYQYVNMHPVMQLWWYVAQKSATVEFYWSVIIIADH